MSKVDWQRVIGALLPAGFGFLAVYLGASRGFGAQDLTLWRAGSALHITGKWAIAGGLLFVVAGIGLLRQAWRILRPGESIG